MKHIPAKTRNEIQHCNGLVTEVIGRLTELMDNATNDALVVALDDVIACLEQVEGNLEDIAPIN